MYYHLRPNDCCSSCLCVQPNPPCLQYNNDQPINCNQAGLVNYSISMCMDWAASAYSVSSTTYDESASLSIDWTPGDCGPSIEPSNVTYICTPVDCITANNNWQWIMAPVEGNFCSNETNTQICGEIGFQQVNTFCSNNYYGNEGGNFNIDNTKCGIPLEPISNTVPCFVPCTIDGMKQIKSNAIKQQNLRVTAV